LWDANCVIKRINRSSNGCSSASMCCGTLIYLHRIEYVCRPCHHSPHKSLAPQERVPRSPAQLGYCRRRCRQDQMGCNLNTATLTMNAQSPHKVVLVVSAVPRPSLQELGRRVRVGSSILVTHGNGAMSGVLSRVGASRRQGDNAAAQVRCWRCVVLCSNGVIVHLHVHLLVQGCQGSRKNRFVDILGGLVLDCGQISSGFSPGHAGPTTWVLQQLGKDDEASGESSPFIVARRNHDATMPNRAHTDSLRVGWGRFGDRGSLGCCKTRRADGPCPHGTSTTGVDCMLCVVGVGGCFISASPMNSPPC
jgi:hypothetical protein